VYNNPKVAMHTEMIEQAVSITAVPFFTYAATDENII